MTGIKHMCVPASEHKSCNFDDSVYKLNALIFVLKTAITQYKDNKTHASHLQNFLSRMILSSESKIGVTNSEKSWRKRKSFIFSVFKLFFVLLLKT